MTVPAAGSQKQRGQTAYRVLKQTHAGATDTSSSPPRKPTYELVGLVDAANSEAAIRSYCEGTKDGGYFVAIPERSWRIVSAKVEQTTVVKVGDA